MLKLNERQQRTLELITRYGEVKIAELKSMFNVTEMTIRRDLEKIENTGYIRRVFGGAILSSTINMPLRERAGVMPDQKIRIGKTAAELVQPGDSIYIDAGTTPLQVASHLPEGMDVKCVTNAVNIASELASKKIRTMVVGGILQEDTLSLVGPTTKEIISKMAFDRVFIGATGITERGFHITNILELEIKSLAIQQASEVNVVIDHTKFGVKALFSFAELNQVHRIITNADDELDNNNLLTLCRENGINIIFAD